MPFFSIPSHPFSAFSLFRPQDTEISLYYAQRVSKPVNLDTFSVQHLQNLLVAVWGEQHRERVKAITDKKELIAAIESSMLKGNERNQQQPRVHAIDECFFLCPFSDLFLWFSFSISLFLISFYFSSIFSELPRKRGAL
jgi:hypothetical protein